MTTRDYKGFFEDLVQHFGPNERLEMDGFEFTEYAEKRGLIKWEPYDPETHGLIEAEPGDQIWTTVFDD